MHLPGAHAVLFNEQTPSSGNTITISGIPATYDDIWIYWTNGRSNDSANYGVVTMAFNGDTTNTNYSRSYWRLLPSVGFQYTSAQDRNMGLLCAGSLYGPTQGEIWVPAYAAADQKVMRGKFFIMNGAGLSSHTNVSDYTYQTVWGTSVITSINFYSSYGWGSPTKISTYLYSHSRP